MVIMTIPTTMTTIITTIMITATITAMTTGIPTAAAATITMCRRISTAASPSARS